VQNQFLQSAHIPIQESVQILVWESAQIPEYVQIAKIDSAHIPIQESVQIPESVQILA
jgi:hypothetical protein